MDWISIVILVGFFFFATVCILITFIGLPGTWLMLGAALVIEMCDTFWGGTETWGWTALGICVGLVVFGEILELLAGALGVKVGGGSKRGMVGAVIGGIVGGIVFTPFIPIPIIGTVIGAIIGTFFGAIIGEVSHKEPLPIKQVAISATGATIGRIVGILCKTGIAAVCWCVLVISLFI